MLVLFSYQQEVGEPITDIGCYFLFTIISTYFVRYTEDSWTFPFPSVKKKKAERKQ